METDSRTGFIPTAERPIREGPTPTVTLVILASGPGAGLDEALRAATSSGEADVLVVHRRDLEAGPYAGRNPGVRWIAVGAEATDDELREGGISAADGDIVRFLDDRFPARWAADDAPEQGPGVLIGGALEPQDMRRLGR